MTNKLKQTIHKLLACCVSIVLLCSVIISHEAIQGPGISDAAAAADLGVLTPTDVTPIGGITEPLVTTSKVNTYVVALSWSYTYVDELNFTISSSSTNTKLVGYQIASTAPPSLFTFFRGR